MTEPVSPAQDRRDEVPIARELAQSFYLMGLLAGVSSGLVWLGLLAARVFA